MIDGFLASYKRLFFLGYGNVLLPLRATPERRLRDNGYQGDRHSPVKYRRQTASFSNMKGISRGRFSCKKGNKRWFMNQCVVFG